MIYTYEERKGSNANGRRGLDKEEIPQALQDLLKKK